MNLPDIHAQLEEELSWRWAEMRLLRNQLGYIADGFNKGRYRKALVVMLYSHFEGFCKTAFSIYVTAINQEQLLCAEANDFIAAASLADVFDAYENRDKKCQLFRKSLPDDAKLHRFARQVDFVVALSDLPNKPVNIRVDSIVDTESNLNPVVMNKILYRLGLPHDAFAAQVGAIHRLLERRNNIAHGAEKGVIAQKDYESLEVAAYDVMSALIRMIVDALGRQAFRRC